MMKHRSVGVSISESCLGRHVACESIDDQEGTRRAHLSRESIDEFLFGVRVNNAGTTPILFSGSAPNAMI